VLAHAGQVFGGVGHAGGAQVLDGLAQVLHPRFGTAVAFAAVAVRAFLSPTIVRSVAFFAFLGLALDSTHARFDAADDGTGFVFQAFGFVVLAFLRGLGDRLAKLGNASLRPLGTGSIAFFAIAASLRQFQLCHRLLQACMAALELCLVLGKLFFCGR
jgi:hypothetical protein